jgi:hypothetical protein
MTRSILCGLLALVSVGALGVLPVACQSGGVGDPCTPEDEFNTQFPGFKIELENIESRSFQCATRICLVNHFQGRVSCPGGQPAPTQCIPANKGTECNACKGDGDCRGGTCQGGQCSPQRACMLSQTYAPTCTTCDGTDPNCVPTTCPSGLMCDPNHGICTCTTSLMLNGVNFACEPATDCTGSQCPEVLHSYVCHTPANPMAVPPTSYCQVESPSNASENAKLDCCVPGTDTPVAVSVCGQCDSMSSRNADQAVYCSCRCCAPCCPAGTSDTDAINQNCSNDMSTCGPACDPNFNYCSCPSGYSCTTIRQDVGLGDKQLAGAYCIKQGSAYQPGISDAHCGMVTGYSADQSCKGSSAPATSSGDGG